MKLSNYEIMRNQMRGQFLQYDQQAMIDKFRLRADGDYLYILFFGRLYRIGRLTGIVEWSRDGFVSAELADYNESMTIYDVLCCSKRDCCLSGQFAPSNSLKGVVYTAGTGAGDGMFHGQFQFFDEKSRLLAEACRMLGGIPEGKGDVAFRLPVFPFLPIRFEFWKSDDEFPAEACVLWDTNVLDFMHYETLWFAMGHLMRRLREIILELENEEAAASFRG